MITVFRASSLGALLGLALSGCGGGDGGGEASADLAGTYLAVMSKTQDTCRISGAYSGNNHVVTVSGSTVSATIGSGKAMVGKEQPGGGLSVGYETTTDGVTTRQWMSYSPIAGDTPPYNRYRAIVNLLGSTQGYSCVITYDGTVTKI